MNTEDFWELVTDARTRVADPSDAEAVARQMVALLTARPATEIAAFAQPLWDLLSMSYRQDLWAAAYLINGGASDDGFEYFRGWLIAQGQELFERAVADPDSLAEWPRIQRAAEECADGFECESMLGVAWDAYRAVSGENLPAGAFTIRHPELEPGWDFEDDREMRGRLPRLAALYVD